MRASRPPQASALSIQCPGLELRPPWTEVAGQVANCCGSLGMIWVLALEAPFPGHLSQSGWTRQMVGLAVLVPLPPTARLQPQPGPQALGAEPRTFWRVGDKGPQFLLAVAWNTTLKGSAHSRSGESWPRREEPVSPAGLLRAFITLLLVSGLELAGKSAPFPKHTEPGCPPPGD